MRYAFQDTRPARRASAGVRNPVVEHADSGRHMRLAPRSLVATLTALSGCLTPEPPSPMHSPLAPREVQAHDHGGALFDALDAPRDLTLTLTFDRPWPSSEALPVLFVQGAFTPTCVLRMGTRLRRAMAARTLAWTSMPQGSTVWLTPREALTPGRAYTLLWLGDTPSAHTLVASSDPALGAQLRASLPAPERVDVPPRLAHAWLVFDGLIDGDLPAAISLRDASGAVLPSELVALPCRSLGLGEGSCVRLTPGAPLAPRARHTIEVAAGLSARTGAAIAPATIAFRTLEAEEASALERTALPCAPDELHLAGLCVVPGADRVSLRGESPTPALITLALLHEGAPSTLHAAISQGPFAFFDVPLRAPTRARLTRTDLSGRAQVEELRLAPASDLARVRIDEVRADARGREPAQEYVELLNSGDQTVSLMGFSLSTSAFEAGRAIASASTLAPGERALLVAPEFDAAAREDDPPPGALKLIRLTHALALPNHGARLFLRDPAGRRVSSAITPAPLTPGQCSARSATTVDGDAERAFELDPDGSCTPGASTFDGS